MISYMSTTNDSAKCNGFIGAIICNPMYYALASVIEIIILILIVYKLNPFNISGKFPVMCSIFIMFVVFFQLLTYLFVSETGDVSKIDIKLYDFALKIIVTVAAIVFLAFFVMGTIWLLTAVPSASVALVYILNFLILIVAVAISYKSFIRNKTKTNPQANETFFSLIEEMIMYIPCAIIDVVDWSKNQYNITTSTTWILISIEIFIISLRIILPKLASFMINSDGLQLLREPVYLNNVHEVGSYDILHKNNEDSHYVYSISAWFWINPQPPNTRAAYTKYTNIIEYGRKPAVEFNGLKNTLRVNCQIKDDIEVTIAEIKDIKLQTWNNIVINYDGSTMDAFYNGVLIGSKPNISPYITMENIKLGSARGIEGGICNVVFSDKIIQERQIVMTYKALREIHTPLI